MDGMTEVRDGDGNVLGWMAPADAELPHERRLRDFVMGVRVDAVDQAADLLMDEAFSLEETWDSAVAPGLPESALDSAGNVALLLSQIENMRR